MNTVIVLSQPTGPCGPPWLTRGIWGLLGAQTPTELLPLPSSLASGLSCELHITCSYSPGTPELTDLCLESPLVSLSNMLLLLVFLLQEGSLEYTGHHLLLLFLPLILWITQILLEFSSMLYSFSLFY